MSTQSPSPGPVSVQVQTRNPISLRLRKILGTNFTDQATTEALRTLSHLYGTNHPSDQPSPVTNSDTESDSESETLVDLTVDFSSETASRARKNLRRDLENTLAEGSRQFLQAFSEVDQKLDAIQAHVSAMRACCDDADAQLRLTAESSKSLLDRAGSLRQEREVVETRKSIVMLFLDRFTVTDEEAEAMTSRDVPVGKRFFSAMSKTERIRADCRVLMSGEDGPTKAGLDIMASTSSYLEQGYEKIYRYCSFEFRQMGRDVHLEVSPIMREAIRRLRQRPELLSEALTLLTTTRQTSLLSAFLAALTRGSGGGGRPIELHAHDPIRYVGDMLAWVHQAIAAECEFLEGLFGLGEGSADGDNGEGEFGVDGDEVRERQRRRMVGSVRTFGAGEEWVGELLNGAVEKLCVPLKVRVQQTVRSQESSIVSYKVANLLEYYTLTMRRTIGEGAVLCKTLDEITEVSYKVFFDAIEAQGRTLLRTSLDPDDPSVRPPLPILEHAQLLREIIQVYDSSLLRGDTNTAPAPANTAHTSPSAATPGPFTFKRILDALLDPALEMCLGAAEEKKRLRPRWDQAVFGVNCLTYLQSVLEPFNFTLDKQLEIQGVIDERVKLLTDEHYENILKDASLYDAIEACQTKNPSEPLARIPATQPAQLRSSLSKFSHWLSGLEVVHSPRLAQLTMYPATSIHQAALARLARAYGKLCEEVRRVGSGYEAGSTLLGSERPFGKIGLLFQIFGLEEDQGEDEDEEKVDEEEEDEEEEEEGDSEEEYEDDDEDDGKDQDGDDEGGEGDEDEDDGEEED
ncbi:oligomeric complex COG6 [Leucogyrophana mollusca]|uniref:Oligomeric complex COG6 n=1 Tax=Leucogyrophana mollusca TaxID=85980 RepID=A0ACB8BGD2_9AGAM|nr:oligomeric complex COG6 [Leucogyrophana mollusca]